MFVITDCIEYAEQLLPLKPHWERGYPRAVGEELQVLVDAVFPTTSLLSCTVDSANSWQYLLIVRFAPRSQYTLLCDLCREGVPLPGGILCVARSGKRFHGFKNRPWTSLPGNIHLSAFVSPQKELDHTGVGFTVLSVTSVVQTIDSLPGLDRRASVKWVNDILVDGAKVSGVLSSAQILGREVTGAVLGIGLNVEATPEVNRDPFVPRAGSLYDFLPDPHLCNQGVVFNRLTAFLDRNYQRFLGGEYSSLLALYRERSCILNREVRVFADTLDGETTAIAHGKVMAIGDDLELHLEGYPKPVTSGRVVLEN